jgi:DNA-binding NarL/FixJ family response regulator
MLLEQPGTYNRISRVVHSITSDPNQFQDLLQEARLQFWLSERRSPHRTLSWYLQACRYAVLVYLRRGRSVDSPKRRSSGSQIDGELEDCRAAASDVLQEVCARDDLTLLRGLLRPREQAVLCLMAEGKAERECGLELAISQQAVHKMRQHICRQATRLGLAL